MSGGRRLPSCSASASEIFSSTPMKSSQGTHIRVSRTIGDDVLSDDEDTFSQLSPIYHDSSDSEEELTSTRGSDSRGSLSPVRCELPRTPSDQMLSATIDPTVSLSPWEMWLVNKAKEDRLNLERKTDEERLLKEKKEQEEMENERKKIIMDEKIQEWLKMKRERERKEHLRKISKEEAEMRRRQEKQRDIEQRAQLKYKDWLQKKDYEKTEKQKKEKEQASLKEEQEKERRRRAEEKFKEWLAKANEKSRASPRSPWCSTNPYDKSYPSPSFCNPIPWKPIHSPPPEPSVKRTPNSKPPNPQKSQQGSGSMPRVRHSVSAPQQPWPQRR